MEQKKHSDEEQMCSGVIPVAFVREGMMVKIIAMRGGAGLKSRFADRGFLPGGLMRVIQNSRIGGPLILEIKNSRYAIGSGEAQKILVQEIDEGKNE